MPTIDIAIPVLNEGRYLRGCLDSVLAFEKPPGVECVVYVLDGGSTDATRQIAEQYATRHPEIHLLDNPGRIQSCGLNQVIRIGRGDYLLRLDAHAQYPRNYLALCLEVALQSGADNVGGVVRTLPGGATYGARVVQALTTHRFGVGNSGFRLSRSAGPADTVPYGFFKRSIFARVGLFDERLARTQDYEMNRRIKASGGTVWLDPRIVVTYYNQPTFTEFLHKQLFKEGPYNAYLWYLAPYGRAVRHGITGAFSAGVLGGLVCAALSKLLAVVYLAVLVFYGLLALIASAQQAAAYKCWPHILVLPPAFFLFHFTHGCGVLSGVLRLLLGIAPVQRQREPWPGAGFFRFLPRPLERA